MRFIRQRFIIRAFSIFCIIIFINSVFYPSISYALTSGPHQPEYTSYEEAGATDMVNLLTGDFSFNLPILSVPIGTEGNFTVPLSYHASISPEQESSWIGLGWNLNVGSITRNINGFPDDASGETQTINVKDLTGDRGWYSNSLMGTFGWDSQTGKYGSASLANLSLNYNEQGTTVGIGAGIFLGKESRFDAVAFGTELVRAVAAVLTEGESEVAFLAANITQDVVSDVLRQDARASSFSVPAAPSIRGVWEYSFKEDKKFGYTNYWYWLDKTRIENMFGILNLDKVPMTPFGLSNFNIKGSNSVGGTFWSSDINIKGSASDINIDLSSESAYQDNISPTLLAYDNFYVNGPGICGNIKPYRMEVGSVSVPREMSKSHYRYNPVPFLDYGINKVPFVYSGSQCNSYYNHVGSNSTVTSPTFYFDFTMSGEVNDNNGGVKTTSIYHTINDAVFLPSNQLSSKLTPRKKLPQGNYIDWLTNLEIKNTTSKFQGSSYLDCFQGTYRTNFRNNYSFAGSKTFYGKSAVSNPNGTSTVTFDQNLTSKEITSLSGAITDILVVSENKDEDGNVKYTTSITYKNVNVTNVTATQITVNNPAIIIDSSNGHVEIIANLPKADNIIGGFVITAADGKNYHYSIPIYDYNYFSYTELKSDVNKSSSYSRSGQFANTWLLTAITGPDFVDRGGSTGDGDGYIDENDWGYWVKFNYGSQNIDYMWKFPYGTGTTTSDSQDKYNSYSQGIKEKYYLNSIETRSHVALFLKGSRNDAKDASASKKPSLRLCEIALLTKGAYKQLIDPAGSMKLQNASGTKDVLYQYTGSTTGNDITTSQENFIQANALRRIIFNSGKVTSSNDYALCIGALNSDPGYGKLTLNSISVLGRNNSKVLPDYKFTYANNPPYDANKWDGWGMYSSYGTSSGKNHKASLYAMDATAWSLTSIKSPMGHSINITHARDTYSSVSGAYIYGDASEYSSSYSMMSTPQGLYDELRVTNSNQYHVGDKINVGGTVYYNCAGAFPPTASENYKIYSGEFVVQAVNSTSIFLGTNYMSLSFCNPGTFLNVSNHGTIRKVIPKPGGNLRVSEITLTDGNLGSQYKSKYVYEENDFSFGVVSVEPDYIRSNDNDYNFYKWVGYPATPVMYGKVSVLTGRLSGDSDYTSKTVYEFETPNRDQYKMNDDFIVKNKEQIAHYDAYHLGQNNPDGVLVHANTEYSSIYKFQIDLNLAQIGKIKSIKTYSVSDVSPSYSQDFIYTSTILNDNQNNYQGVFTEGTVMCERVVVNDNSYNIDQRTTTIDHPYALKKIVTTIDNQTSESTNMNWDLITGGVIEKQDKSPLGIRTKTIYEPLYKTTGTGTEYYKLGSKAIDPSYKNMLSQIASTYQYQIDASGNELGLIGASATSWKKDMYNYRVLQNGNYANSTDLYDLDNNGTISVEEMDAQQAWRKSVSYIWMGDYSRLNPYGIYTFGSSDKFNFSTASPNLLWKRMGSFERFNHNSQILESRDMNGLYSSAKYGYNEIFPIASAANARYEEIAFSGAEEKLIFNPLFFGGEVAVGSGSVVTSPIHTGTSSLSLSTGYGFIFKSSGISANKNYRASVWTSNSTTGRIYYKINNGIEISPTPTISQAIVLPNGSTWYRLDLAIPIGNIVSPAIEVGVKSTGGTVYFDDFRFQPSDAAMTCNVYNPNTYNLEYVLDNDNLYIRYEYNDRNILAKTYGESLKTGQSGEKLLSESKSDFRRFHFD